MPQLSSFSLAAKCVHVTKSWSVTRREGNDIWVTSLKGMAFPYFHIPLPASWVVAVTRSTSDTFAMSVRPTPWGCGKTRRKEPGPQ